MVGNPYSVFRYLFLKKGFEDYIHVWAIEDMEDNRQVIEEYAKYSQVVFVEYQSIARYKNKVCTAYNIRQIRIHDFRHSHVSLLVNLDCSIMMIADRIGDTPATVQSTYAHLYPEKKDAVLEKLDEIVSK